jgi:hypothetical protein
LRALEGAIQQTERALRAAGVDIHPEPPDPDRYKKYAGRSHPHLRHTLTEILEARAEIKAAGHDFGGERERTPHELSEAADQVEHALEFSK